MFPKLLCFPALALTLVSASQAAHLSGRWDATLTVKNAPVPFRFDLMNLGSKAKGTFFDGGQRIDSTRGHFAGGRLQLHFDAYDSDLDVRLRDGVFTGTYVRHYGKRERIYPFAAKPFTAPAFSGSPASIAGSWRLADDAGKQIWTLQINQQEHLLTGAILRLDGDSGALAGSVDTDTFKLSHFSGARPTLIEGTYQPDGTLVIMVDREEHFTGVREAEAQRKQLAPPPDPFGTTTFKDPTKPFEFQFPDAGGRVVSAADFRGKVLIVSIGGTWCPNCMDEAPFLIDLYRQNHARGLEIVGINFETGDEAYNRTRVKSFIQRFGVPYPIVIAGAPEDAAKQLPQLVNFTAFPTTIFIGRDGLIKVVHDGFASVATGAEHEKLKQETNGIVERLLAARE